MPPPQAGHIYEKEKVEDHISVKIIKNIKNLMRFLVIIENIMRRIKMIQGVPINIRIQ